MCYIFISILAAVSLIPTLNVSARTTSLQSPRTLAGRVQTVRIAKPAILVAPALDKDKNVTSRFINIQDEAFNQSKISDDEFVEDDSPLATQINNDRQVRTRWLCQIKSYFEASDYLRETGQQSSDRLFFLVPMILVYWHHRYPHKNISLVDIAESLSELRAQDENLASVRSDLDEVIKLTSRQEYQKRCYNLIDMNKQNTTTPRIRPPEVRLRAQGSQLTDADNRRLRIREFIGNVLETRMKYHSRTSKRKDQVPSTTQSPIITTSEPPIETSTQTEPTVKPEQTQTVSSIHVAPTLASSNITSVSNEDQVENSTQKSAVQLKEDSNSSIVIPDISSMGSMGTQSVQEDVAQLHRLLSIILSDVEQMSNTTRSQ